MCRKPFIVHIVVNCLPLSTLAFYCRLYLPFCTLNHWFRSMVSSNLESTPGTFKSMNPKIRESSENAQIDSSIQSSIHPFIQQLQATSTLPCQALHIGMSDKIAIYYFISFLVAAILFFQLSQSTIFNASF